MSQRRPIDATMITELQTLRNEMSLHRFAQLVGLSTATLAAALAGQNVNPGTKVLLAQKLKELKGRKNFEETSARMIQAFHHLANPIVSRMHQEMKKVFIDD